MTKEIVQYVDQAVEITADGRVSSMVAEVGQVVRATPNSGGKEYVRLQFNDGRSYKFDGEWNEEVSADPEAEKKWIRE